MNVVEIIPQLFFDLIARAVPGSVFLGLIMYGNRDTWQTAVERLWPTAALSPVYGLAVFIGVAYVIGHILAAPAQLFDGFIDRRAQKFIDRELGKDAKKIDECWGNLDWLRVHQPDLAIIPTKIFAEYTMYSELAVAFLLATMGTLIGILQFTTRDWLSI